MPHTIDGKSLDINVSIGVSTYPGDGQDAEGLMNKADTAMYEAKQRGRNNYQFFRHDMHARLAETAIARSGFALRAGAQRVFAALPADT